ncbi:hypothetical protein [Ralstonia solanacearum]|uniref:hypothetical protein n=1 Tax=Ralstonia solanacearum TaxID=305 RepID=UPI0010724E11|nr:hypothetical protein [Ralstonia solanacearum]
MRKRSLVRGADLGFLLGLDSHARGQVCDHLAQLGSVPGEIPAALPRIDVRTAQADNTLPCLRLQCVKSGNNQRLLSVLQE